jgi:hypothetical protein
MRPRIKQMTPPLPELKPLSVQALVDRYTECATARRIANDDITLGARHFDEMIRAYVELKSCGLDAQRTLLPLLDHSDPNVRLDAAIRALEFAPNLAVPALRALLPLHGFLAFQADHALERWEKGELKFPPYAHTTRDRDRMNP